MGFAFIGVFILGLIVGSFVNVLIYRIPQGKSIRVPFFVCAGCGKRLAVPELVPVVSYVFHKGRCRYCGERISPRYPLVEVLMAVVFTALFYKFGFAVPFFAYAFLMTILTAIFFIDIDHRVIPDSLVIAALIGGTVLFAYNCFIPQPEMFGEGKWWTPLAGVLPGSGFLLLVALLGSLIYRSDEALGMGDVKLMAPIGLFLGWRLCITALFISVVLGGAFSLLLMIFRIKKRRDTIAFGPFIVIGTFIAVLWGRELIFNQ